MLEEDDNGVYTEVLQNGTRRPLDAFDAQSDVMQEVTKEYADRFLRMFEKKAAERSERAEQRAHCAGGEGAGIFVVATTGIAPSSVMPPDADAGHDTPHNAADEHEAPG